MYIDYINIYKVDMNEILWTSIIKDIKTEWGVIQSLADLARSKVSMLIIWWWVLAWWAAYTWESWKAQAQVQTACAFTWPAIIPCAVTTTSGTIIIASLSWLSIFIDRLARWEVIIAPQPMHSWFYRCRSAVKSMQVRANSITRACTITPSEYYECWADQRNGTRYFTCVWWWIPRPEDYGNPYR